MPDKSPDAPDGVLTGSHEPTPTVARPADQPASMPRIGRFELRAVLGEGAFGRVYRAFDPDLDREVALKVPLADALRTPADRDRFLKEARAAATVAHPNVCQIHEVGVHDGAPYIVMALVPGQSLADVLRGRKEPLAQKQAAVIVRKLAVALDAAHKKGVVHRDLKPANVMFDRERRDLVVMDFGLARRAASGDARDTQSGVVMGTPAYMSPEQARGDSKDVGPEGDIFSLGIIMYELLTGGRPFTGTAHEVIGQILLLDAEPPSERRAGVDPALEAACLKALEKDPRNRFASMREFAAAIDGYLNRPASASAETAKAVETKPADPAADAGLSTNTRKLDELFVELSVQRKQARAETAEAVEDAVSRHSTRTRKYLIVGGVLLFLLAVAVGAVLYFGKKPVVVNNNTVKVKVQLKGIIDLSDKTLRFTLDGKEISAAALDEELDLTPGEHELIAYRGTTVVKRLKLRVVVNGTDADVEMEDVSNPVSGVPPAVPPAVPPVGTPSGVKGLELVHSLAHPGAVYDAAFSTDGKTVHTVARAAKPGQTENAVVYWNATAGVRVNTYNMHSSIAKVGVMASGGLLFGFDGVSNPARQAEFLVWLGGDISKSRTFPFDPKLRGATLQLMEVSRDGKRVLTYNAGGRALALIDIATGTDVCRIYREFRTGCLSHDEKTIWCTDNSHLYQFDIATQKEVRLAKRVVNGVSCLACSADGRWLLTGGLMQPYSVLLWDLKAPELNPITLGAHAAMIASVAISPNSKTALSLAHDGTLRLWDLVAQEEVAVQQAHKVKESPHVVRFSPDGTHAVTASNDGFAKVWKLTK